MRVVNVTEGGIIAFYDLPPLIINQFISNFILNTNKSCDRELIDPVSEYYLNTTGRFCNKAIKQSICFWVQQMCVLINQVFETQHQRPTPSMIHYDLWEEKEMGEEEYNIIPMIDSLGSVLKNFGDTTLVLTCLILLSYPLLTPDKNVIITLLNSVDSLLTLPLRSRQNVTVSTMIKFYLKQLVANFPSLNKFLKSEAIVSFHQSDIPTYVLFRPQVKNLRRYCPEEGEEDESSISSPSEEDYPQSSDSYTV